MMLTRIWRILSLSVMTSLPELRRLRNISSMQPAVLYNGHNMTNHMTNQEDHMIKYVHNTEQHCLAYQSEMELVHQGCFL